MNLQFEHVNIEINGKLDSDTFSSKNQEIELDLNKTHKNVLNLLEEDKSVESDNIDFHTANNNLLGFIEQNDRQFDKINKLKEALGRTDSKDDLKGNKSKNNNINNKKNINNKTKKNSIEENNESIKEKDSNNTKAQNSQKNTNNIIGIDIQNENKSSNKNKDKKFNNFIDEFSYKDTDQQNINDFSE